MEQRVSITRYLSTGFAMFNMFFGAGNVIFPLVIGQVTGSEAYFAILGLLITAVGVPFMGLMAIILFQGNYEEFFGKMGKTIGLLLSAAILLLIGPFGAMPRCIALSFSTLKASFPSTSLWMFSLISCVIIFCCTYKKNRLMDLIGIVLTPFLLISLAIIVLAGLFTSGEAVSSSLTTYDAFKYGLLEGYNTMDLLASFFFSTIVYQSLKGQFSSERKILSVAWKSSLIGAGLLSLVYIGFSLVAAYHAESLQAGGHDQLLGMLTLKILGPYAGLVASLTIALACLTTAIALASVFADFLQKTIFKNRIGYGQALMWTLLATFGVSTLEFKGIVALLAPILQVVYPALIVLTITNVLSRLYRLESLKVENK